jgi:hypothetical protein
VDEIFEDGIEGGGLLEIDAVAGLGQHGQAAAGDRALEEQGDLQG